MLQLYHLVRKPLNNNPTFVYICRRGENEELRYSIRSVMSSFPDATIWVIGEPPRWYSGNKITVIQDQSKYKNAYNNLRAIIKSSSIPEKFVLMNDDFFILNKVDTIENFIGGTLWNKVIFHIDYIGNTSYTKMLKSTYDYLVSLGYEDPLDYELHVPINCKKSILKRSIKDGLLWRSIYGNLANLGGKQIKDVKVYDNIANPKSANIDDITMFLSTDDASFNKLFSWLTRKFPKPSIYES